MLSLAVGGVLVDFIDIRLVDVLSAGLLLTAAAVGLTGGSDAVSEESRLSAAARRQASLLQSNS